MLNGHSRAAVVRPVPSPLARTIVYDRIAAQFAPPDRLIRREQTLVFQGDVQPYVFLVVSGCFRSCLVTADGHRVIDRFVWPGDLIGFGTPQVSPTQIVAVEPARVRSLPGLVLRKTISCSPGLQDDVAARLAAQDAAAAGHCARLSLRAPAQRLASFLLALHRRFGAVHGRGEVTLPMRRRDIADHLAITAESVSRAFGYLVRCGLIRQHAVSCIELLDRQALADLAGCED